MPKLSKEFKESIEKIPVKELQKLVVKMATKNKEFHDYIKINYIEGKEAEEELFENTRMLIYEELGSIGYRGVIQKRLAKAITKAVRHINHYAKISKNKEKEAELLVMLLEDVFEDHASDLGTCWTAFDSKLAVTTGRLYNLVTKKLHEDYLVEFREPLDRFLSILHRKSRFLDCVYKLPKSVEADYV